MVNKKILIISSSADISGAPLHALEILGALYKKYKFFVAVPLNQKLSKKFLYFSDNRVIHLEKKIRTIFFLRKLKAFVQSNNIEVIHSIGKSAGLYGRALKWLCPSVVHIFSSQGVHYDRYGFLKKIMFNIYEVFSHTYVDKFVFASNSEVEKARRYMPWDQKKGIVINNGVRVSDKILDRNFKASKHSPLRVLSVCRLDPVKDISCFCEIARLANQMSLPLKFEIVGTGEEREALIEKINAQALTNIKYHGEVKNTEKFYERSHIFISCSHYEALSLSLLEAMSFGMTCIVTDVDGNNDLIENKFNGFLFEKNTASKCIKILKKVISNPKLLYDTGRNAKKTINDKYSLKKMISSIEEVYSNKSVGI